MIHYRNKRRKSVKKGGLILDINIINTLGYALNMSSIIILRVLEITALLYFIKALQVYIRNNNKKD